MAFHLSHFYRKSVFHHHFHYIVFLFFSSVICIYLFSSYGEAGKRSKHGPCVRNVNRGLNEIEEGHVITLGGVCKLWTE